MSGYGYRPAAFPPVYDLHPQAHEGLIDLLSLYVDTEEFVQACVAQGNLLRLRQCITHQRLFNGPRDPTDNLQKQCSRPLHRIELQSIVYASFISVRCIRVQAITTRSTRNRQWRKKGTLKENIRRIRLHTAALTAHHTRNGHRAALVSNEQGLIVELNHLPIQKR